MDQSSLGDPVQAMFRLFKESGVPKTTPEVAEKLDIGRRTAYNRLQRLTEDGHLETKKVGANARVWWRPIQDESHSGLEVDSLVEAVEEYAIFTLDTDGHVQTWNRGAEQIMGYAAPEILGEHFSMFYTEEKRARGVPSQI